MKKTLVYCALTWTLGIIYDLPLIFGWGRQGFSDTTLSCLWLRASNHGYTLFMPITGMLLPPCIVMFFYIKIFLKVRSAKRQIQNKTNNQGSTQVRIAKGLFAAFTVFLVSW